MRYLWGQGRVGKSWVDEGKPEGIWGLRGVVVVGARFI